MSTWRSSSPRRRSPSAPASFVDPAQPVEQDKPPSGADWLHEIKHDGYRLQIHKHGDRVRLYTFTGIDWTSRYPWIVEGAKQINADHAVIDAEAVVAGPGGITVHEALHSRLHDASAFAYAFDLLAVEGEDIRALPIEQRKQKLAAIIPSRKVRSRVQSGVQISDHLEGNGAQVFLQACLLGLEGIVSKKLGSKYRSGRCSSWIKVKNKAAPGYLRFRDVT